MIEITLSGEHEMERHPLSAAWPDLSTGELNELQNDVRARGVLEPICVYESKVLDGWHRWRAARGIGLTEIRAVEFGGSAEDARDFVIGKNARRRHLSKVEVAQAVLRTQQWRPVGRPKTEASAAAEAGERPKTTRQIADEIGASAGTVAEARRRLREDDEQQANADGAETKASPKPRKTKKKAKAKTPPKVQREQRLESRVETLTTQLSEAEERVEFLRGEQSGDAAQREAKFAAMREEIRTLRGQVAAWQTKYDALRRIKEAQEQELKRLRPTSG